jgi:hypothetical protein
MWMNVKTMTLAAVACIAAGFGVASAQVSDSLSTGARSDTDRAALAAMTPQQMLQKADTYLQGMEQGASSVRRQLEKAREARDVVKVLCLNDKLNQINVAVRTANERRGSLSSAAERNNADRARHEFTVIEVLHNRLQTLVKEANQCIGEEIGFAGEARLTVSVNPELPAEGESVFPEEPVVSMPPTLSSPTD